MKIPTDISFESSYVTHLSIQPYTITMVAEFALRGEHPRYTPEHPGKQCCYQTGTLTIKHFSSFTWSNAGGRPGINSDGTKSWDFDNFEGDENLWHLLGGWGSIKGMGGELTIKLDES